MLGILHVRGERGGVHGERALHEALSGPSRFETTKQPDLKFRALLTDEKGDARFDV
jgi:hypothetical protein